MERITLRPATSGDLLLLYNWANDPVVRANSFHTENISLDEHKIWFENCLADENIFIFILMLENIPIGQVRLNKTDNFYIINYSIDINYRAQGYGKIILQLLENTLLDKNFGGKLVGYVKKNNVASQLIFKSLSYTEFEEPNFYRYEKQELNHYNITPPEWGGVLLLSNNRNSIHLYDWINENENVIIYSDEIFLPAIKNLKPRLVISYDYSHEISDDVRNFLADNLIELLVGSNKILLEIGNYSLREITPLDLKMILEWRNSPRVHSMMLTDHKITWEEHLRWFAKIQRDPVKKHTLFYFKDTPIGYSAYNDFDGENKTCSPGGYVGEIDKSPKDAGIFSWYMGLAYGFDNLGILKYNTTVFADNKKALKLNKYWGYEIDEKNGYFVTKDGKQKLLYDAVLTKERFEERRVQMVEMLQLDEN